MRRLEGQSQAKTTCVQNAATLSYLVTVTDGAESMTANGPNKDGREESTVSPKLAERAVFNGIGKMTKIDRVTLQVGLKNITTAQSSTFSCTSTPLGTAPQPLTGPLALVSVALLSADDEFTAEDLSSGPSVLKHLGFDTRTRLEQKLDLLVGTDSSSVRERPSAASDKTSSRLKTARMNKTITGDTDLQKQHADDGNAPQCPKVYFYKVRTNTNPFLNNSFFNSVDSYQHGEIVKAVGKVVGDSMDHSFSANMLPKLRNVMNKNVSVYPTSLLFGPLVSFLCSRSSSSALQSRYALAA